MLVKENFMVCSTLGDIYIILLLYRKIRIPRAESTAIQFILSKKLWKYS